MEERIHIRKNLSLTPFKAEDKPLLIQYLNDPGIYRNTLLIPSPYTEADADWWINRTQEIRAENGATYYWAIRDADLGLIGGISAFLRTGVDGHLDEIGYWLGEPFRGQGIMTDAVRALCNHSFETRPNLVRIEAKVYSFNPSSARVLEKAGFVREGFARKHTIKNGALIDVIMMALIRE